MAQRGLTDNEDSSTTMDAKLVDHFRQLLSENSDQQLEWIQREMKLHLDVERVRLEEHLQLREAMEKDRVALRQAEVIQAEFQERLRHETERNDRLLREQSVHQVKWTETQQQLQDCIQLLESELRQATENEKQLEHNGK